ncbi:MAG: hypothetical protein WBL62_02900 [Gallionella sp.]
MSIEEAVAKRLQDLIDEAESLRRGDENGQAFDDEQMHQCAGWLPSALNIVQILCPNESNAFRKRAEEIAARKSGWVINSDVGEFMSLLQNLVRDIDAGLLTSIADRARAETFDEFLDHGRAYLKEQKKQEARVICGVVFEDTVRRICRKYNIEEAGVQLDSLISALTKIEVLTGAKAKRARVASHVRTKATHAQWEEFDISDVSATIDITQELINVQLDK